MSTEKNRNDYNKNIMPYLISKRNLLKIDSLRNEKSELYKGLDRLINTNDIKLKPYGYILCELSYYFRCNIFHGSKPLLLFCYDSDPEYLLLRFVSNIIENFLDSELHEIV